MKSLIKKELIYLFCSPIALCFSVFFLVAIGLMNWFFDGSFNILDAGYANMTAFFELASILLLIFIPALTMRSISEEKRNLNIEVMRSRPISIASLWWAKFVALLVVIFVTLGGTVVYVFSLSKLSIPVGNVDYNEIVASYISLFLLSGVYLAIGVFASSLTKNQIIAFFIAILLNFVTFYGFDLLATTLSGGALQYLIQSFGIATHFELMKKGVLQIKDVLVFVNYILIFSSLSIFYLSFNSRKMRRQVLIVGGILLTLNIAYLFIPNVRFDFTSDKRYTISNYTHQLLEDFKYSQQQVSVNVYLTGDLNPGFIRLQQSVKDMLSDFQYYSNEKLSYQFINPYSVNRSEDELYSLMHEKGMPPIMLNEKDRDGKVSRKVIYPYAEVVMGADTLVVNLLKNIPGYTAEENLNASVENIEFGLVDALRILREPEGKSIAFIEGHGELLRPYVYDAEEILAKYFFVNRGQIENNLDVLDGFKVVIIAGPRDKFSERDKFIIDQYIMSGGRVLWLIDGVYLSSQDLKEKGESPSMKHDVNLDDMLFNYGVRIESSLVQDAQCLPILVASGSDQYIKIPSFYLPLLLPANDHVVTKDLSLVKGAFISPIKTVDSSKGISKKVLLTSSANSKLIPVPEMISLDVTLIQSDKNYFDDSYIPVAMALEGQFESLYKNRMVPDSIVQNDKPIREFSVPSKMIVVSSSDVIRNDLSGSGQETEMLPLGYDRVSERQYGNREFIVNAVNWLANDDGWLDLRAKQQKIRLLDKNLIIENRNTYAIYNVGIPVLFVVLLFGVVYLLRRQKYSK